MTTTLLITALAVFPATRIANLPSGRLLESGSWQFGIAHRFLSAEDNSTLRGNFLNFFRTANVLLTVDRGISDRFNAGIWASNEPNKEIGVRGVWAPTRWTAFYSGIGVNVIDPKADNTWASLALAVPVTVQQRLHLLMLPRATTSFGRLSEFFLSLGLAAVTGLGNGLALGFETEPILIGPTTPDRYRLAWNLAFDKELGWHNFTLVLGNCWAQTVPASFSTANRDILKGRFRIGFNILRRF